MAYAAPVSVVVLLKICLSLAVAGPWLTGTAFGGLWAAGAAVAFVRARSSRVTFGATHVIIRNPLRTTQIANAELAEVRHHKWPFSGRAPIGCLRFVRAAGGATIAVATISYERLPEAQARRLKDDLDAWVTRYGPTVTLALQFTREGR